MESMTYFLNMSRGIFFIINIVLLLITIGIYSTIVVLISNRLKFPDGVTNFLIGVSVFAAMGTYFFGIGNIFRSFNYGGVKEVYILPSGDTSKLSVWSTRIYSKKVGANYEQLLTTYDLKSGKCHGSVQLTKRHYSHQFYIFRASGEKAWSYYEREGIKLLDMAVPCIIANEETILAKNPSLGSLKLRFHDNVYDPSTNSLYAQAADGRMYQLKADLSATPAAYVPSDKGSNKGKWKFNHNWYFQKLKDNMGKHAHTTGTKCAPEAAILLEPELIPELNFALSTKEKVWVTHKSSIIGSYEPLISYMSGDGKEHSRINLREITGYEQVKTLYTYTKDKEVMIFVSSGKTHFDDVHGFTLIGLRTDAETGKLLDRVTYF
jgi:hypothetical protein